MSASRHPVPPVAHFKAARYGCCIGLSLVLAIPSYAACQELTWPPVGARVRFVVPENPYLGSGPLAPLGTKTPARLGRQQRLKNGTLRLDGFVVAHNSEHLRLQLERPPGEIQLARSDATAIEIHTGRTGHGLAGAIVGGTITGFMGYRFEQALADNPGGIGSAAVGAVPGALLGLLIGAAIKTDVWRPAPDS